MTTVRAILEQKGHHVVHIAETATVREAAQLMREHRIGAIVVTRGDKVVGIFTERDILNRVVAVERDPTETTVSQVMSAPVAVCGPDTRCDECRAVMRNQRLRHLPVVDAGQLVGMVSIGDLNKAAHADQAQTIQYLYEYMYGEWR